MSYSSLFLTFIPPTEDDNGTSPPASKKQRTAPAQEPSLLLETNADILGNVYSFLTLRKLSSFAALASSSAMTAPSFDAVTL